jgi:hypothetical protein
MAGLSDADIVALAMGISPAKFKIDPLELAKLSKDKTVRERARKIVLRAVERLTIDGDVDPIMRRLIRLWCRQELRSPRRGRPKSKGKEGAIYSAFKAITNDTEGQKLQRKAIISRLAEKFGVKERRVYEALDRQDPRKQMERIRKGLDRSKLSAEDRKMAEALFKQFDLLGRLHLIR